MVAEPESEVGDTADQPERPKAIAMESDVGVDAGNPRVPHRSILVVLVPSRPSGLLYRLVREVGDLCVLAHAPTTIVTDCVAP